MEFNEQNFSQIHQACVNRQEFEFLAPISATAFSKSAAPEEWRAYPPSLLPPEGYAHIFLHAGSDLRGSLMKLELLVFLEKGRILYRAANNDQVAIKVTWPNA